MIRRIGLAAVLGALVAACVVYAARAPDWRNVIAAGLGASEPKLANEDWPICTTMGLMGSEADWAQLDRHLIRQTAKRYVKRGSAFRLVSHGASSFFLL